MVVAEFLDLYSGLVAKELATLEESVSAADPADLAQAMAKVAYRKISSPSDVFEFEGCTTAEVDEVRTAWDGWLPESLEAYLLLMGRQNYYIDLEFGLRYPEILDAAGAIDDWLDELGPDTPDWYGDGERFRIPEGANHLGHRGGGRFFFVLDQVADPVVYEMWEGKEEGSAVSSTGETFSEIVLKGLMGPRRTVERALARAVSGGLAS